MIIKSTLIQLEADNIKQARSGIEALVTSLNGSIHSQTGNGIEGDKAEMLRIRVPEARAAQVIDRIASYGFIIDRQDDHRDVTSQYNNLAIKYNDMNNKHDQQSRLEQAAIKQQLDSLTRDAGSYTLVLWLIE